MAKDHTSPHFVTPSLTTYFGRTKEITCLGNFTSYPTSRICNSSVCLCVSRQQTSACHKNLDLGCCPTLVFGVSERCDKELDFDPNLAFDLSAGHKDSVPNAQRMKSSRSEGTKADPKVPNYSTYFSDFHKINSPEHLTILERGLNPICHLNI